ncbi:hypothetical protein ALI22I_28715 [Saccharothrix sp. ALI-22-I]|nr:hypothetical protein ALI22I_28715 [Saccharothrix sp. ALI-22-I]
MHGPQEDTGQKFCPICMEFLVPCVEPLAQMASAVCGEPGCGMPLADGLCPVHSLDDSPQPRRTTRDPGVDSATVLFPWGPVVVDGEVWIGRAPECGALADRVDRYDNVSRRHAVLRREGAELTVRDQDSLNGTFVNDRRLERGEAKRLRDGDVVRFAADLTGTVHLGSERS